MLRSIQPELLDSLPPGHPDALQNRRDLHMINRLMGSGRWFKRILTSRARSYERVLEIGAGTGELALSLTKQGSPLDGLDLWPRPSLWPASARWHSLDVHGFSAWHDYRVVIGNLIFHQFDAAELRSIGEKLRPHTRLLAANEPARLRCFQWFYRAFSPLLGLNPITRHDGYVSIAAGFIGDELPALLGLTAPEWSWQVRISALGAYRMIAEKRT